MMCDRYQDRSCAASVRARPVLSAGQVCLRLMGRKLSSRPSACRAFMSFESSPGMSEMSRAAELAEVRCH